MSPLLHYLLKDVVCVGAQCPTLLRPHGLQPTRLLCPWSFPGKDTGVGCHFRLHGIFLTLGIETASPALAGGFFTTVSAKTKSHQPGAYAKVSKEKKEENNVKTNTSWETHTRKIANNSPWNEIQDSVISQGKKVFKEEIQGLADKKTELVELRKKEEKICNHTEMNITLKIEERISNIFRGMEDKIRSEMENNTV